MFCPKTTSFISKKYIVPIRQAKLFEYKTTSFWAKYTHNVVWIPTRPQGLDSRSKSESQKSIHDASNYSIQIPKLVIFLKFSLPIRICRCLSGRRIKINLRERERRKQDDKKLIVCWWNSSIWLGEKRKIKIDRTNCVIAAKLMRNMEFVKTLGCSYRVIGYNLM